MQNKGLELKEGFREAINKIRALEGQTVRLDDSEDVPDRLKGELAIVGAVSFRETGDKRLNVDLGVRDLGLAHRMSAPIESVVTIVDEQS